MEAKFDDLTQFHDAELTGLSISRTTKQLRLVFLAEGGAELRIAFEGVRGFRAVDIGVQNVVSQIVSTQHSDLEDGEILRAIEWLSSMIDAPSYLSMQNLSTYLDKIRSGELRLLMIDASAGGSFGVLSESIALESESS